MSLLSFHKHIIKLLACLFVPFLAPSLCIFKEKQVITEEEDGEQTQRNENKFLNPYEDMERKKIIDKRFCPTQNV